MLDNIYINKQEHIYNLFRSCFGFWEFGNLTCMGGGWGVFPGAPQKNQNHRKRLAARRALIGKAMQIIADNLREWAQPLSRALAGGSDSEMEGASELRDGLRARLEFSIGYLHGIAISLAPPRDKSVALFESAFLLRCWMLNYRSRSPIHLRDIVDGSFRACLPDSLRDSALKYFQHVVMPSPGTMSRMRFRLDSAYMKYMKVLHTPPPQLLPGTFSADNAVELFNQLDVVRIWWLDSSPQGQVDWMVISSVEVKTDDLWPHVIEVRRELRKAVASEIQEHLPWSAIDEDMSEIENHINKFAKMHRWPLTSLGAGKGVSGLAHKVACWIHSAHLESSGPFS